MPKLTIDGIELEVAPGTNLVEAAKTLGIEIPTYCYHPALSVVASCRMCLVEVGGAPKPLPACATAAAEGMVVKTTSPVAREAHERVLEFLLLNHPLDCPVCDKAGECQLQDFTYDHGTVVSRFREEKRVPPKKDLGQDIMLYTTRCILCTRCTRFMNEVAGTGELAVVNRGGRAEIDLFPGIELGEGLTGNITDICPVGALKSKDFLFQARVWNLTPTDSVCAGCATGCSIRVDSLRGEVKRVKPRENPEVNGHWICDEGRYLWHQYHRRRTRVTEPMRRHGSSLAEAGWPEALAAAAEGLTPCTKDGPGTIALVGSAYATNEENFILRRIGEALFPRRVTALYPGRGTRAPRVFRSGFTISGDRAPNREGALAMLGLPDHGNLDLLWTGIEEGLITAAIMLGGSYLEHLEARERELLRRLGFLVVLDCMLSELTEAAHLVLPGAAYTEKAGTMVNGAGHLQKLERAVAPPGRARDEASLLRHLSRALGHDPGSADPEAVFAAIAATVPGWAGLTRGAIPAGGLRLAGAASDALVGTER